MRKLITLLLITVLIVSCVNNSEKETFINDLLSQMTLDEKIGQMNQYNGFWDATGPMPEGEYQKARYRDLKNGLVGSMLNVTGVDNVRALQKIAVEETRLGIPLIFAFDVIHGYETISPIPLAESASWDLEAIEKSARVAAIEASAAGLNWTFAPMVDISRDARWGRVMEGAGEDPFLGSLIAKARVKGFQGDDLSAFNTIAACAKHFASYGFAEAGRDYNTADTNEYTLFNTILPPFKAAVDAGVSTFMNSFNTVDEIPATGSTFLQRDILKGEWGFNGFVVSDWGSIGEMIPHGYARDGAHAAEIAANAGSDMDMESSLYVRKLNELVTSGKVDISIVDDAVSRILGVKYDLGLFDDPYKYCNKEREKEIIGSKENQEAVLDIARKSIVLLKNENQLLPLKKNNQTIAVIGQLANDKNSSIGNWRGRGIANSAISVLEGLKSYEGNKLIYKKGVDVYYGDTNFFTRLDINYSDRSGFNQARLAAKSSDVVIMVLGEEGFQTGEGRSRTNLLLPGLQQELLEEVYKVNKNVVLVLVNGRPLNISWADENIPAIVEAWQLGSQAGNAIAQVLYGDYNPSGKLTMSFPRNVGQVPIYYNYKNTGRPSKSQKTVTASAYSDVENSPLYPFGYGLSYTSFDYSDLKISSDSMNVNQSIIVSVTVANSGKYKGKEVVQLYTRDLYGSLTRPLKELKGFKMVELEPGESKTVNFTIDNSLLKYYTVNKKWESESGDFNVYIGGDSNVEIFKKFKLID
ncbi:MAG: beta-glucosidase BglX [Flavobacteriales bacterium]|nr:MAG: beta-glucosidase BglX [Flavobacteriales bacterium]|tara:strand:- start:1758 stop:4013 length:2256 start_codon:yes stop_codon:yes gene_type:complete